jgi:predicted Rossmann fold flavoprotein
MQLFESLGVKLKVERGKRVFPASDKSLDLIAGLRAALVLAGVEIKYGARVTGITVQGSGGFLLSGSGFQYRASSVIIACGGLSYPRTGSSGDGYSLAQQMGHSVVPARAALVPLETREKWVRNVQGLSLRNIVLKSPVGEEFGEMLFTHYGISGPVVLTLSSHIVPALRDGPVAVAIDLKPALSLEVLSDRLQRDFVEFSRKQFGNSLTKLLPASLIDPVIDLSGISRSKPTNQITRVEREHIAALLKAVPLTVVKARPIDEAIVTAGGVHTGEINPRTMESKLIPGLYFCGEVIDVDAYTGGYNLQIAWSTGVLAGNSAALRTQF